MAIACLKEYLRSQSHKHLGCCNLSSQAEMNSGDDNKCIIILYVKSILRTKLLLVIGKMTANINSFVLHVPREVRMLLTGSWKRG